MSSVRTENVYAVVVSLKEATENFSRFVETRFNRLETRFDRLETRVEALEDDVRCLRADVSEIKTRRP